MPHTPAFFSGNWKLNQFIIYFFNVSGCDCFPFLCQFLRRLCAIAWRGISRKDDRYIWRYRMFFLLSFEESGRFWGCNLRQYLMPEKRELRHLSQKPVLHNICFQHTVPIHPQTVSILVQEYTIRSALPL